MRLGGRVSGPVALEGASVLRGTCSGQRVAGCLLVSLEPFAVVARLARVVNRVNDPSIGPGTTLPDSQTASPHGKLFRNVADIDLDRPASRFAHLALSVLGHILGATVFPRTCCFLPTHV